MQTEKKEERADEFAGHTPGPRPIGYWPAYGYAVAVYRVTGGWQHWSSRPYQFRDAALSFGWQLARAGEFVTVKPVRAEKGVQS